jgi:drug/metabolite transporter (DMT)-like permease
MSDSGHHSTMSSAVDPPVHIALLAVQVSFGGFHVVAKTMLSQMEPLALAGIRVAVATPILMLLAWHRDRCLPRRSDLPILALLGLLGVAFNQILFIVGLQYTTATNAAILMVSIPVFAVAVAALLRIEAAGWRRAVGIALAVSGALVLLGPARLEVGGGASFGNLLILINCLSYAAFLVLQRPVLERLPWRTVIAWSFLFGSLVVLGASAGELRAVEFATVSRGTWLGLAYIIALPTIFSYAVATWAVKRSSPLLTATYTTVQPLVAAILATWFLGESLGAREFAGFALIVAGLLGVSWRRRGPSIMPDHE